MFRIALFDLDDTLYDRSGLRPEDALCRLERTDRPPSVQESWSVLARRVRFLRNATPILEALQLPHLQWNPASPATVSLLRLLWAPGEERQVWGITDEQQRGLRGSIKQALEYIQRRPRGAWQQALWEDMRLHAFLQASSYLSELPVCLQPVLEDAETKRVQGAMDEQLQWQCLPGVRRAWQEMRAQGVHCFVATDGMTDVQLQKLHALELSDWSDVLLTTEAAGRPEGFEELQELIRKHLQALARKYLEGKIQYSPSGPEELAAELARDAHPLAQLYPFFWTLEWYAGKTPGFYARLLHAITHQPENPQAALEELATADLPAAQNLELTVIGDSYKSDVAPLHQLLGPKQVITTLFARGRHAQKEEWGPDRHPPTLQFEDWETIHQQVADQQWPWGQIHPPKKLPPLVPSRMVPEKQLPGAQSMPTTLAQKLARVFAKRG